MQNNTFTDAVERVASVTGSKYLGMRGVVDSVNPNLPVVFYTHPFCSVRDRDSKDDLLREASLVKSLKMSNSNLIFVLGADEASVSCAKEVVKCIGRETYFVLSQKNGMPSHNIGSFLEGLAHTHVQARGVVKLSTRSNEVYSVGSYLDRCHLSTYCELRQVFSKTIVPLGSVFTRWDWKPDVCAKNELLSKVPEMRFGPFESYIRYDWADDTLPEHTYKLTLQNLEECLSDSK